MVGTGPDAGPALLVGQALALLVNLPGQVRNGEQVHILEAVGLPQHILGVVDVKVHPGRQGKLRLLTAGDVEAAAVYVAQPLHCVLSCHGSASLPAKSPLTLP